MFRLSHINIDGEGFESADDYQNLMQKIFKFNACRI
jgi:hypothetical protein